MNTLTDDDIKSIISRGSISYAFGFLTQLCLDVRAEKGMSLTIETKQAEVLT